MLRLNRFKIFQIFYFKLNNVTITRINSIIHVYEILIKFGNQIKNSITSIVYI